MTEKTPWRPLYDERQPAEIAAEYPHLRAMWSAAVERGPDQPAIRYFDGVLTVSELDAASDALAAGLQDLGFGVGDRIVLFLQNNPAFVIGMLAAYKYPREITIVEELPKTASGKILRRELRN